MPIRYHDKLYLKTNRYDKPKIASQLLDDILKKRLSKNKTYKLLDVGCANGELLYFLNKKYKNINFCGVDIRNDLLKLAKKKLPEKIILKKYDYNKKAINEKFDIILCSGVISIFDNLDNFFKNIKKNMKKNTVLFLFGSFNKYDFDVIVKYKDLNSKRSSYEPGWNIWSMKTIKNYFKLKKFTKHPFNINIDLKPNKKDLLRTWTVKINKKRYFTNCLKITQSQMWLEIR